MTSKVSCQHLRDLVDADRLKFVFEACSSLQTLGIELYQKGLDNQMGLIRGQSAEFSCLRVRASIVPSPEPQLLECSPVSVLPPLHFVPPQ